MPPRLARSLPAPCWKSPLAKGSLAVMSLLLVGGLGWLISGTLREQRALRDDAAVGQAERDALRQRIMVGDLSEAEQYALLDQLFTLGSLDEALLLLEHMADRLPSDTSLRLMLAELRRTHQQDPNSAERELRLILNRSPAHLEALQMLTLVQLEQNKGDKAEKRLRQVMKQLGEGKRMEVGFILAELLGRQGNHGEARDLLRSLAKERPEDVRPHLARALSAVERGLTTKALAELESARKVGGPELQPLIDSLAASWSLDALRSNGSGVADDDPDPSEDVPDADLESTERKAGSPELSPIP